MGQQPRVKVEFLALGVADPALPAIRRRRPRRDAVDEDPVRREFESHRPRQVHDPGLRGDVRALQPHRHEPEHRRDVDDASRSSRLHVRNDRSADAEHAGQIDAQHLVPGLDRELVDGLAVRRLDADPGIVDEDVDAPCRAAISATTASICSPSATSSAKRQMRLRRRRRAACAASAVRLSSRSV